MMMMMMMMMMMSTPLPPLRLFLVFFRQSLGVVVVAVVAVPTPPSSLSLSLSLFSLSRYCIDFLKRRRNKTRQSAKKNEADVFCVLLPVQKKSFPERIVPSSLLKRGGWGKTTTRLQKRGAPPPLFVSLRGEEYFLSSRTVSIDGGSRPLRHTRS